MRLPHSLFFLLQLLLVFGAPTNTTIDDSNSSFTFSGNWNTVSPSSPCQVCSSRPDSSRTHDSTWHDGNIRLTAPPTTGSLTFTGTGVYIYGIDQAISQADIVFTLGSTRKTHHYTGTEQFSYNALFFSATGLSSGSHTVNWELNINPNTGVEVQTALFDYAVVTSGESVGGGGATGGGGGNSAQPAKSDSPGTTSSSTGLSPSSNPSSHASDSASAFSSNRNAATSIPSGKPGGVTGVSQTVTISGIVTTITANTEPTSSSSSKTNVGAIVGGVIGALAVAALAVFLLLWRHRRLQHARLEDDKMLARSHFLPLSDYPIRAATNTPNSPSDEGDQHSPTVFSSQLEPTKAEREGLSVDNAATSTTSLSPQARLVEPMNAATRRDLSHLEERLATLEAQLAEQQPPPYLRE